MTVRQMHHVGVIVEDLEAAIAFFAALGLTAGGTSEVSGAWVDRIVGLDGIRNDVAMVSTPDGTSRLELIRFHAPEGPPAEASPPNVPGLRHVAFVVDDLEETLAQLRPHGAELIGEVVDYEDVYRLCYVRGPAGIIVELAQELG